MRTLKDIGLLFQRHFTQQLRNPVWLDVYKRQRVNHAEDLGSPRGQLHPGGIRLLRKFGGDRRCRTRPATDADDPVVLAEPLGIELAHYTKNAIVEQTPVATGNSRLGGSEDLSQAAERRSGVDIKRVNDSLI